MKSYNISIPDNKATIFIEIMKNLKFVKKIQEVPDLFISEEQKEIVLNRLKEDPEEILSLTQEQKEEIIQSKKEIKKGLYIENEAMHKEVKKWLNQK
jgi:hypothetical protein